MNTVVYVGVVTLGAVVAYLTMYFISRFSKHTVAGLTSLFTLLFGGVIVTLVVDHTKEVDNRAFWLYPIGFVVGLLVWAVVKKLFPDLGIARTFQDNHR